MAALTSRSSAEVGNGVKPPWQKDLHLDCGPPLEHLPLARDDIAPRHQRRVPSSLCGGQPADPSAVDPHLERLGSCPHTLLDSRRVQCGPHRPEPRPDRVLVLALPP